MSGAALAALLAAPVPAWVGGESGAYLRAPVGATAFAMGGAFAAAPQYLACWWNPAALAAYRERHAALGMGVRSLGRMEGFGGISFRIPTRFGLGVSMLYRGDPFLDDLYDENENPVDGGSYSTLTFKAGVGYLINRSWSAGIGFGVYYQSLPTAFTSDGVLNSTVTGIGGFTLALRYQALDRWCVALMARNLGLTMDWEITASEDGYYGSRSSDKPLPEFVLASRFEGRLLRHPLVWTSDLAGYVFDGDWERLPHAEAQWHNGVEWRRWESFYLRLGLGDVPLSGTLFNDASAYFDAFSLRVTGGFAWQLKRISDGLWVNYGIASDKSGMLFDQVLDISLAF